MSVNKKIRIVAHRGGPTRAPENTLRAYKQALLDGADAFECDVALTKDGEPTVIHIPFYSDDLSCLTAEAGRLSKVTWSQLKNRRVKGELIPHLDDVLRFVSNNRVKCFIEPKRDSIELLKKVIERVDVYGVREEVYLLTFFRRQRLLHYAKQLNPRIKTAVITLNPFFSWTRMVQEGWADIVVPGWKGFNHLFVIDALFFDLKHKIEETQASGIPVFSGIADDEKSIRWLCNLGVDGIFTNNVSLAKQIVTSFDESQMKRSATESSTSDLGSTRRFL